MSLNEIIEALILLRQQSPLHGDTAVCICVPGWEYQPVTRIKLAETEMEVPSGVVLVFSESLDEIVNEYVGPA